MKYDLSILKDYEEAYYGEGKIKIPGLRTTDSSLETLIEHCGFTDMIISSVWGVQV